MEPPVGKIDLLVWSASTSVQKIARKTKQKLKNIVHRPMMWVPLGVLECVQLKIYLKC